ncbi:thiosulfate dehydrogenase [quinone] large subunit [Mariniphaga anaerophila]|uniref:Thiosulfate dehydrogenase [quinone] large subunit n=1 Tax=Mariniphaga anaerophila TaxID=1484053 RepID=A0A1M4T7S6_9BACT|nr:DoxX family membrane protein [Mariniphaga anaerophila]SHE40592.1 thiosulfate dehydrogenase [quinone] large subunit [Mariniphaga anaerophila]
MKNYSKLQLTALVVLRFLVGWHILYEGIAKLLNPQWTSAGFLDQSQWILSGFADWVTSNAGILAAVDFLNTWGLIAIGLGLVLGLLSRPAAIAGAALVFVYYLNTPPLIGLEYALPVDGNNLVVNKTLIEAAALCVLALFPTSKIFGLDYFLAKRNN